uniref:collagen alpha-1(IX) chain-like n=1 Tax=Erigeron canadensis TaxID=72917 RepID=UPI001CB9309F|nr:collagen alpha-1(IX) chain-like [Erigeron canadensis]
MIGVVVNGGNGGNVGSVGFGRVVGIGNVGRPGAPGIPGIVGRPGAPGRPGIVGRPGAPGRPGIVGRPGAPGRPGIVGRPGAPGRPGIVGRPGVPGRPGNVGRPGVCGIVGNGKVGVEPGIVKRRRAIGVWRLPEMIKVAKREKMMRVVEAISGGVKIPGNDGGLVLPVGRGKLGSDGIPPPVDGVKGGSVGSDVDGVAGNVVGIPVGTPGKPGTVKRLRPMVAWRLLMKTRVTKRESIMSFVEAIYLVCVCFDLELKY